MAQQDLTINFKVNDQGTAVLEKIKGSVSGIQNSINMIQTSALVYLGSQLVSVAEKFGQFYEAGAKAQAITDSFNRITAAGGIMGQTLVASMKNASDSTIAETDMMVKAQQLLVEGFTGPQITDLMEAARVGAQKMGITVSEAFNVISEAVIRGNVRGAIREMFPMEVQQTFDTFARTIGSIGPNLSEAGRQQAVYTGVMKQYFDYVAKYGPEVESSYEKHQKTVSALTNVYQGLAGAIVDAANGVLGFMDAMAKKGGQIVTGIFGGGSPSAEPMAGGMMGGVGGAAGAAAKTALPNQKLLDQEKVNALMIEERGILLNLNMEHAKSVEDIAAEIAITGRLGQLEIDRLAQEKKLTPEIKAQIQQHTLDQQRLIESNDTLKEVQRRIADMEAHADAEWAVEQARIDIRKHADDLKQQQNIEDLNYEQQIASLHGQDIEAIKLQEQAAISAATYNNKIYDTTQMKAYFGLLKTNASDTYKLLQGTWDTISSSMSSNLTKMAEGQQNFKTTMLKIWGDIESYVIQALMHIALQQAMLGNSKTLSGAWYSGGGLVGLIGSLFHQEGGVFNQPTLGVIGESGPEAVVPLKNGKIPVEGGGGTTVIYNNMVNAVDAPSFIELCRRNPAGIMQAIKKDADSAGVMRNIIKGLTS